MTLHINLIIQNNQFHFIPKSHLHFAAFEGDFSIFSISWLFFTFLIADHELLSAPTYWREIVKELIDNDEEKMERLEVLVNNYEEYTDEQFAHKARWIAKG